MNTRLSTPSLGRNLFMYVNKVSDSYKTIVGDVKNNVSNLTANYKVRKLKEADEHVVKDLIKSILLERGGIGVESLYYDREFTELFQHYSEKNHSFHVLTHKKEIIGTVALGPSEFDGTEDKTCEVKKVYLKREFRGKGQGKLLMQSALNHAIKLGYERCVVEIEERSQALLKACLNYGFKELHGTSKRTQMEHTKILTTELI